MAASPHAEVNAQPIQLQDKLASIDVQTGKWSKIEKTTVATGGRCYRTLQDVQDRFDALYHIKPETQVFLRMCKSEKLLEEFRKTVIEPTIREFEAHQQYLTAIKERVLAYVEREWVWYVALPLIGYLFKFVVALSLSNLESRFSDLKTLLANRVKELTELKVKFQIAEHVTDLLLHDDFISQAFKDISSRQAEELLVAARAQTTKKAGNVVLRRDFERPEFFIISQLRNEQTAQVTHCPVTVIQVDQLNYKYEISVPLQDRRFVKLACNSKGSLRQHLFKNSQQDGIQTPASFDSVPGTPRVFD